MRVCGCVVVVLRVVVEGCTGTTDCCVVDVGRTPRVDVDAGCVITVATGLPDGEAGATASTVSSASKASRSCPNTAPNIATKAPRHDPATHQRDLT